MRKWLVFLLVGALLLFQVGNVFAAEVFKGEYTRHTGKVWAYPGENVRFIVSNPNVAEEFRYKNGEYRVRFKQPGDVEVKAIFQDPGQEPLVYRLIFHITGDASDETAIDLQYYRQDVLDLVNQEREKAGLQPLQLDEELNGYAERRLQEVTQYFSHQRPDGSDFNTLVPAEQARKYIYLGENLQRGANSPVTVVANWMLSPTHKANILYPDYNVMGLAYVYKADDNSHHYWVQWFGRR
ncbi:MAG: CAP domain-containing protein [Selenomonadaceae bacterium]|nr:CAP domain-containing protein [Selenomonadaceae bacterium]